MKRQITLMVLAVLYSFTILGQGRKKPNLIIVHTDEHNFRTLSCYQKLLAEDQAFVWGKGNNVNTTNIDKLAEEGAICTSYYASSPVCTPSRASLVTGLYPQATGAPKNGLHLSENVTTFAQVLEEQGYATSYVGKWHLAGHDKYKFNIAYKAGFSDNRFMMTGGHTPYFLQTANGVKPIGEREFEKLADTDRKNAVHVTDYFTDKTLEILERDKDKPFCVMLSIPDPHTPDVAPAPYDKMYEAMNPTAPKTMSPALAAKRPAWGKATSDDKNEGNKFDGEALKQYFGMVKKIDDSVGKILDFLEVNGLTDNTIVVFTSDHGDMFFEHNRRNKGVPYESSARIPFVIRYPDKIPSGKVIETAYTNVDFAPTILGLMGAKNEIPFHGINAAADFTSKDKKVVSDRITYYAKSGGWWVAAVDHRYKLVIDKKEGPWLLDLEKDPDEVINFYHDKNYAATADKMQKELFVQLEKFKEPGLASSSKPFIVK
ncbi:sulfatase [Reichenbachiella carrageenanivorans]|uniref:Sulfatase n=1 Tax=Reichenbachiella carrageenanivorans TaxID=2979869 RepID=A0ABY6D2P4_9BACT|nr:sulfatase [Reichenbachiella carrageenanivorans]UXX78110.1 sulfatase [Reichenbachiella carrageenanivorans]